MNDDELAKSQATIVTLETEIAALTQTTQDSIERAREFNARAREASGKKTSLQLSLDKLKKLVSDEVNARAVEAKRKANEAAAAARAEAEAKKAAEPQQPDPVAVLTEQVAALTLQLEKMTEMKIESRVQGDPIV